MIDLDALRAMVMPGTEWWIKATPAEREAEAEKRRAVDAEGHARTIAYYNSLSPADRKHWDETDGYWRPAGAP